MKNIIITALVLAAVVAQADPHFSPANEFAIGEEVVVQQSEFYSHDELGLSALETSVVANFLSIKDDWKKNKEKEKIFWERNANEGWVRATVVESPSRGLYTLEANIRLPTQLIFEACEPSGSYEPIRNLLRKGYPLPNGVQLKRRATLAVDYIGKLTKTSQIHARGNDSR